MVLEKLVLVAQLLVAGKRGVEAIVRAVVAAVKVRLVLRICQIIDNHYGQIERKVGVSPVENARGVLVRRQRSHRSGRGNFCPSKNEMSTSYNG